MAQVLAVNDFSRYTSFGGPSNLQALAAHTVAMLNAVTTIYRAPGSMHPPVKFEWGELLALPAKVQHPRLDPSLTPCRRAPLARCCQVQLSSFW